MDLLAVYAKLLCCCQVFTLENIVVSLFSNIYKVVPPICILAFNLLRSIQLFKFTKIERMLFKPYGLEYQMYIFFSRNIYLSVQLLTHYPPHLVQEERQSILN